MVGPSASISSGSQPLTPTQRNQTSTASDNKEVLPPQTVQAAIIRSDTPTDSLNSRTIDRQFQTDALGTSAQTLLGTNQVDSESTSLDAANQAAKPVIEDLQKLRQYIDDQINKYEGWKKVAATTAIVALSAIAIGIIATAALYISPIIPFSLVLLVPALILLAVLLSLLVLGTGGGTTPLDSTTSIPAELIGMAWKYSAEFGIQKGLAWSRAIYTVEVAKIVGLVNAGIAAVALPVAAGAGIAYLVNKKKVAEFKGLKNLVDGIQGKPEYDQLVQQNKKLQQLLAQMSQKTSNTNA